MMKGILIAVLLAAGATGCATSADSTNAIRLDATSASTAKSSFAAMAEALGPKKRQELLVAMVKLNLAGVESAYEVVRNQSLQSLSIVNIKDQVAGMTAQEIIDLAERTSSVEATVTGGA